MDVRGGRSKEGQGGMDGWMEQQRGQRRSRRKEDDKGGKSEVRIRNDKVV